MFKDKFLIVNFKLVRLFFISFSVAILLMIGSCNKEVSKDSEQTRTKSENREEDDNNNDSNFTPAELFGSSLVEDILGEDNEVELQIYLEEQIYPLVSKSSKVTIDKISPSLYLLTYEANGALKQLAIQKFYNPVKEEFVFEMKETDSIPNLKF